MLQSKGHVEFYLSSLEKSSFKKGENRLKYLCSLNIIPDYISDIPVKIKDH